MGGFGSGGHNKRRDHLEGRNRISVRFLRQRGFLRDGVFGSMAWTDNWDRPTGSIQIVGGEHAVTLTYSTRRDDADDWRRIEDRITLVRMPKPFGGEQVFFLCPRCDRRCLTLAMGSGWFRCRLCQGLVHGSSQQSPVDRAMRRANKLKKRLGAEPGLDSWYTRPKHMRRTTFERIDARIQAAEAEVNDAHIRLLGRLTQLKGRSRRSQRPAPGAPRRAFW